MCKILQLYFVLFFIYLDHMFQDYCPIFPCMFSDLPHYPRQKIVLRRNPHIPPHIDTKWKRHSKYDPPLIRKGSVNLLGADMVKFIKWLSYTQDIIYEYFTIVV